MEHAVAPDPVTWVTQIVGPNGALFLLLIFITGLTRKWWVLGWQYDELRTSRDRWEAMATRNAQLADRSLGTVEKITPGR